MYDVLDSIYTTVLNMFSLERNVGNLWFSPPFAGESSENSSSQWQLQLIEVAMYTFLTALESIHMNELTPRCAWELSRSQCKLSFILPSAYFYLSPVQFPYSFLS